MNQKTEEIIPDDIPEPTVPAEVSVPPALDPSNDRDALYMLAHEEFATLRKEVTQQLQHLDLHILQEMNRVARSYPDEAHIQATSSQGFTVTIIAKRVDPPTLIDAIGKIQSWLAQAGYTAR